MNIAYYITAHGFGHGVRSTDILRALAAARPDVKLHVVTDLPDGLLRGRLAGCDYTLRAGRFDVGMVQIDSVRVDLEATRRRVRRLLDSAAELVAGEQQWLEAKGMERVVCDVPALPLVAAARAGISGIAVGNFTWDWIYEPFGWAAEVAAFRLAYAEATLALRLPFAPVFEPFRRVKDVGLVASPGEARRAAISERTGADAGKTWALLSFSTLEWDASARAALGACDHIEWFTIEPFGDDWTGSRPVNMRTIRRADFVVPDLFASVDVVVTKPGFGVLSDCVVNDKPMVWVDREGFRETPVLVRALKEVLRQVEIPAEDLYAGRLAAAVCAALDAPRPVGRVKRGGAAEAARFILETRMD